MSTLDNSRLPIPHAKWSALQGVAESILARRVPMNPMQRYMLGRLACGLTAQYSFYKGNRDVLGDAKALVRSVIGLSVVAKAA